MKPTTIFFVRHGEVYNPQEIVYLRSPRFRLSKRGVQEVETTAKFLRREPLSIIYSSPMLRARQTAKIIQNYHPNALIRITKYLNELKSSYQGVPRAEMIKIDWNFYDNRKSDDDETREDILKRLLEQLKRTIHHHESESVVWVAHGDVIIIFTLWGKGMPLAELQKYKGQTYIGHASVTKFVFQPRRELPVSVEYFDPPKERLLKS